MSSVGPLGAITNRSDACRPHPALMLSGLPIGERIGVHDGRGRTRHAGAELRQGSLEWPKLRSGRRPYGENYVNPFGTGPSARVKPIRHYHAAFPDLHLDVEELIVAGDTVVIRLTFRGTDTGGYVGRPPTGRAVEEWVVDIMHFEGDRVVSEWIGADKLGLFIQLGVLDDPGRARSTSPPQRDN